jgi:hypothetical protein
LLWQVEQPEVTPLCEKLAGSHAGYLWHSSQLFVLYLLWLAGFLLAWQLAQPDVCE